MESQLTFDDRVLHQVNLRNSQSVLRMGGSLPLTVDKNYQIIGNRVHGFLKGTGLYYNEVPIVYTRKDVNQLFKAIPFTRTRLNLPLTFTGDALVYQLTQRFGFMMNNVIFTAASLATVYTLVQGKDSTIQLVCDPNSLEWQGTLSIVVSAT